MIGHKVLTALRISMCFIPTRFISGREARRRLLLIALLLGCQSLTTAHTSAEVRLVSDAVELKQAIESARPGDILQLQAGQWRDLQITVDCRGTVEQPVIVEAAQPGIVQLTGHTRLRIGGEHVVIRNLDFEKAWHADAVVEFRADSKKLARHCTLEACRFHDCYPEDLELESKVVSLYGSDHRVTRCEIEGKRNRGATVVVWLKEEPVRHRLDRNYFGPREKLGKNGGETIRIGDSATSLVSAQCRIEENLFEECNGEAEIISNKSCDNIYAHNTFRRCAGALTLRHGHRCRVEGNFFVGESAKGTGGVRIIGEEHIIVNNLFADLQGTEQRAAISIMHGIKDSPLNGYSAVQSVLVLFNTLVDCKQSVLIGLVDEDNAGTIPATDCRIVGNIFHSRYSPLIKWVEPRAKIEWDSNCFSAASKEETFGTNRFEVNPLLKREPTGMFRLTKESPLRAQYSRSSVQAPQADVTHDIQGQVREARTDLGCAQVAISMPALYRPLTKADVGRRALAY